MGVFGFEGVFFGIVVGAIVLGKGHAVEGVCTAVGFAVRKMVGTGVDVFKRFIHPPPNPNPNPNLNSSAYRTGHAWHGSNSTSMDVIQVTLEAQVTIALVLMCKLINNLQKKTDLQYYSSKA